MKKTFFFSERELKKALPDTLTLSALFNINNGKLANQMARLVAVVVFKNFFFKGIVLGIVVIIAKTPMTSEHPPSPSCMGSQSSTY